MTQRVSGIVFTFTDPVREDDIEYLLVFLRNMKNVADVRPVESDPTAEYVARIRGDAEWRERLDALQVEMLNRNR